MKYITQEATKTVKYTFNGKPFAYFSDKGIKLTWGDVEIDESNIVSVDVNFNYDGNVARWRKDSKDVEFRVPGWRASESMTFKCDSADSLAFLMYGNR